MEKQIAANNFKTWLLFGGLVLMFAVVGLLLIWLFQSWFLGLTIIALGIGYLIYSYFSAVRKIIKFSGAVEAKKSTHRQLYLLVENMSITLGIATPKIYVINSPSLNAFAAGYKPNKAIVGVTSGLLQHLNKQELEGVIAHEMSHIVNRDTKISTLVFALLVSIAFMLDIGRFASWGGSNNRNSNAGWIYIAILLISVVAAVLGFLLQAAISRRREYLADHTGAYITRYPEGLAAALRKIQAVGSEIKFPKRETAVAHLFLNPPTKPKKSFFNLLATHPPIEQRIAALEALKNAGL